LRMRAPESRLADNCRLLRQGCRDLGDRAGKCFNTSRKSPHTAVSPRPQVIEISRPAARRVVSLRSLAPVASLRAILPFLVFHSLISSVAGQAITHRRALGGPSSSAPSRGGRPASNTLGKVVSALPWSQGEPSPANSLPGGPRWDRTVGVAHTARETGLSRSTESTTILRALSGALVAWGL
jgi:hypothetical protein